MCTVPQRETHYRMFLRRDRGYPHRHDELYRMHSAAQPLEALIARYTQKASYSEILGWVSIDLS